MLAKPMEKIVVDFMEEISVGIEDDESMDGMCGE